MCVQWKRIICTRFDQSIELARMCVRRGVLVWNERLSMSVNEILKFLRPAKRTDQRTTNVDAPKIFIDPYNGSIAELSNYICTRRPIFIARSRKCTWTQCPPGKARTRTAFAFPRIRKLRAVQLRGTLTNEIISMLLGTEIYESFC